MTASKIKTRLEPKDEKTHEEEKQNCREVMGNLKNREKKQSSTNSFISAIIKNGYFKSAK